MWCMLPWQFLWKSSIPSYSFKQRAWAGSVWNKARNTKSLSSRDWDGNLAWGLYFGFAPHHVSKSSCDTRRHFSQPYGDSTGSISEKETGRVTCGGCFQCGITLMHHREFNKISNTPMNLNHCKQHWLKKRKWDTDSMCRAEPATSNRPKNVSSDCGTAMTQWGQYSIKPKRPLEL